MSEINKKKEKTFLNKLLKSLNEFRSNPKSLIPVLETSKLGLSRFNSTNNSVLTEMTQLIAKLPSIKPMPIFKLNEDLCESANEDLMNTNFDNSKLQRIKSGDELKDIIPDRYLDQNCLLVKDDLVSDSSIFIQKLIVNQEDTKKKGKTYIFDNRYKEIGIAVKYEENADDSKSENESESNSESQNSFDNEIDTNNSNFSVSFIFAQSYVEPVSEELPDMDLTELKMAFDCFDINKVKKIDPVETAKQMKNLGYDETNPELYIIMKELETKGKLITFPIFAWHVVGKITDTKTKEGLRTIFNLFVDDRIEDTVSAYALKKIVYELGDKNGINEVEKIMNYKNAGNIKLSFDEFYDFMMNVYNIDNK